MLGGPAASSAICSWSRTQATVALSSREAEYVAAVSATSEGLYFQAILQHCGCQVPLTLFLDSSGARAVCARQWAGRIKHLEMRSLWLHEMTLAKGCNILAVRTKDNIADCMTKAVHAESVRHHLAGMGLALAKKQQTPVDQDVEMIRCRCCEKHQEGRGPRATPRQRLKVKARAPPRVT